MNPRYFRTALVLSLCFVAAARADIKIGASGVVRVEPDRAFISFSLAEKNPSVVAARQKLDDRLKELRNKAESLAESCVITPARESVELADHYGVRTARDRDYVVGREFSLSCPNDPKVINALVDMLLAGPCETSANSMRELVTYGIRNSKPYLDEAFAKALAQARSEAEMIAQQSGLKLGRVTDIKRIYVAGDETHILWGDGNADRFFSASFPNQLVVSCHWYFTFATE